MQNAECRMQNEGRGEGCTKLKVMLRRVRFVIIESGLILLLPSLLRKSTFLKEEGKIASPFGRGVSIADGEGKLYNSPRTTYK